MYEYYNPHPHGKNVGDCVKRALTKASGKTYQEVSNELNRIKRSLGARAYNSNPVWNKYLTDNLKSTYISFPAEKGKPRMNGRTFCETHPEGTYVLRMAGHLSSCVDGVIYDTWDCSDKCVYGAHLIEGCVDTVDSKYELVPMPGIEKLASLKAEYSAISGNDIIVRMASSVGTKVKKSKGTLWISLNPEQYATVLDHLLHDKKYSHFRWETKRGSKKSRIWDENTGMTLILKLGDGAYLWCTNEGNR